MGQFAEYRYQISIFISKIIDNKAQKNANYFPTAFAIMQYNNNLYQTQPFNSFKNNQTLKLLEIYNRYALLLTGNILSFIIFS